MEFRRAPRTNRFLLPPDDPTPSLLARSGQHTPTSVDRSTALTDAIAYAADPLGFVLNTFPWGVPGTFLQRREGPYEWQLEVLSDMRAALEDDPSMVRVAIASGKGAGKTTLAAWVVLWHLSTHPESQTVCTSVTAQQAQSRLWREIRKWRNTWSLRDYFTVQNQRLLHTTNDTWFAMNQPWNLDRVEAFQGVHEQSVCFVVDECSGIPDEVLSTIESGLTDSQIFLLYTSNPTRAVGRFRECFYQRAHLWHTYNIDTRTVEAVNQERIKEQLEEAGGDVEASSFRINVRGLFPLEDYDQVIPEWLIDQACQREPILDPDEDIFIGVDVARFGVNKTIFTARQGPVILERETHRKLEIPETARRLMLFADKYRFLTGQQPTVCIDSDGIGAGVFDLLNESRNRYLEPYEPVAVHSGIAAEFPHRYANRRAELWFIAREWLRVEGCLARDDKLLHEQLTAVTFKHDLTGRMLIESKTDMAARGVPSPDEADSFVYSLATSTATLTRD